MLKSFTTILLLGAAKALTVDDVDDLQVEFVHGISSSPTEWYPSYVSSGNSNKTLTSGTTMVKAFLPLTGAIQKVRASSRSQIMVSKFLPTKMMTLWVTWIPPMGQLYPSRLG